MLVHVFILGKIIGMTYRCNCENAKEELNDLQRDIDVDELIE